MIQGVDHRGVRYYDYLSAYPHSTRDSFGAMAPFEPTPPAPAPTPAPTPPAPKDDSLLGNIFGDALRQVTPTLLLVGIATGAAFAIGSGLVSRYVFSDGKKR